MKKNSILWVESKHSFNLQLRNVEKLHASLYPDINLIQISESMIDHNRKNVVESQTLANKINKYQSISNWHMWQIKITKKIKTHLELQHI